MDRTVNPTLLMLLLMVWPSLTAAAPVDAAQEHLVRVDEHDAPPRTERDAERFVDSARRQTERFDALSPQQQVGPRGEQLISLAVDDYIRARELRPGEFSFLEEEAALLERFGQLRDDARAEGKGEGMPPGLAQELERVRAEVEGLRRVQKEAAATAKAEQEAARLAEEQAARERTAQEAVEPESEPVEPGPRFMLSSQTDAAILGSGLVATAGGAALIGGGVWMFGAAVDRRDDQRLMLDANEYADEQSRRERLDQWYRRGRGIATGLTVSGIVVVGTGLGLTTWGAIRAGKIEPNGGRSRARVRQSVALLGTGWVAIVGGASLIGAGARAFGTADDRHETQRAALDAAEYSDEEGLREDLERWYRQSRGIGWGLTVGGAVLVGVGAGLTAWGLMRSRRRGGGSRGRAGVIVPLVERQRVGIAALVRF